MLIEQKYQNHHGPLLPMFHQKSCVTMKTTVCIKKKTHAKQIRTKDHSITCNFLQSSVLPTELKDFCLNRNLVITTQNAFDLFKSTSEFLKLERKSCIFIFYFFIFLLRCVGYFRKIDIIS